MKFQSLEHINFALWFGYDRLVCRDFTLVTAGRNHVMVTVGCIQPLQVALRLLAIGAFQLRGSKCYHQYQ